MPLQMPFPRALEQETHGNIHVYIAFPVHWVEMPLLRIDYLHTMQNEQNHRTDASSFYRANKVVPTIEK